MASERMLMPNWARTAARVLSDANMASTTKSNGTSAKADAQPMVIQGDPSFSSTTITEDVGETVGGTVSRKGKFGFTCESCGWVPKKGDDPDWVTTKEFVGDVKSKMFAAHWPERCKKCKSRMKRWTCAARKYDQLEILRTLEGRHCLRFLTLTRETWSYKVPDTTDLWAEADIIKKKAVRQFKNWRDRNKYWKSRKAKGQAYYECTMKPVMGWMKEDGEYKFFGYGFDQVKLHFHIHTVVCSKRIENKDIQIDIDTLKEIPMSTTIQREWGGIVDVRACKTWKHKDGAVKTSKRFVMNYLVDYINKSPHWQSVPFGDWSS